MTYMFLHLTFDLVSSRAYDCGLSDSTVMRLKKEFVGRFNRVSELMTNVPQSTEAKCPLPLTCL
jgi:hypothetical protein